jgi:hypothetical protein
LYLDDTHEGGFLCPAVLEVGDRLAVVACPVGECLDRSDQCLAEVGEAVADVPSSSSVPFDEAVTLQAPEGLGQDLARDAADQGDQFAVPSRLLVKAEEDERGPLVGEDLGREPGRAVGEEDRSGRSLHGLEGTKRYLSAA